MISLEHTSARAGAFTLADVSFEIPRGGYGVVIGPAGSGKTTLLEVIAGVVPATAGRVSLGGEDVTHAPPEVRGIGMVYQHAFLFPHLSVRANVEYAAASLDVAREMSARLGVDELQNRSVESLSGGERQLVALARALARRPAVLLLDEAFSALDPRTRNNTRRVVRAIYQELRFTALQVTHDFAEAGLLGDVAIILDRGRVVQQGDPADVFRKPATPYIADFLGAENVFAGIVQSVDPVSTERFVGREEEFGHHAVEFTTGNLTLYALGDVVDGPAHAVLRAEEISLAAQPGASSVQNQIRGRIVEIVPAGALTRITLEASGTPIVAAVTTRAVRELALTVGDDVVAAFKATAIHFC